MKLINKIEKAFSNLFGEKKTDKYGSVVEINSWANATLMGSILHSICSNRASMILSEGVQYAPEKDQQGGIIVLSMDTDATQSYAPKMAEWLKQQPYECAGYTMGHYFGGTFTAKNGSTYGKNSLCVEIIGKDTDALIGIAEDICRDFNQSSVLLKDYSLNRVLLIDPKK